MPLKVEGSSDGASWIPLGVLGVGSPMGTLSHNPAAGGRELIVFRCRGDHSVIELSNGADFTFGAARYVIPAGPAELVTRLEAGESYEMPVIADGGWRYTIRWTHEPEHRSLLCKVGGHPCHSRGCDCGCGGPCECTCHDQGK